MFRVFLCFFLGMGPFLMAAGPADREGLRDNEDIQFIRNWEKEQRLKSLAADLALSNEQADQLRAMRAEVDRVKERFSGQKDALKAELEAAARTVRQRIENGGSFENSDKEQMAAIRERFAKVKKEERLNIGLAILNIDSVLTDEQKQMLRRKARQVGARAKSKRGEGRTGQRMENGERGEFKRAEAKQSRRSRGEKRFSRRGGSSEGRLARILLSDGFLKNLG